MSQTSLKEKLQVAGFSVFAAIVMTGMKFIVGILTGSLGILSEAIHSCLDLIAAVITFFSVRISDKPADEDHNWGHGKVENMSAFFETILLFITCFWIIYEAISRLISHNTKIEINVWSYVVVVAAIVIDITRSRALFKVAKKYNSQALEADALHFSTDILSSSVVLIGLICANFGLFFADSIAALMVAVIVIFISYRLGKSAIDVLLDKTSIAVYPIIEKAMKNCPEITKYHDVKIRTAGPDTFIEINIHVQPNLTIHEAHEISHKVESEIEKNIDRCSVHIHAEPDE